MAGTTTSVDLSQLPLPAIVETLDFETIVGQQLADFYARMAATGQPFTALVESDPAYKVIESAAYRELLVRQRANEACKAVMLAYAAKADLDQIGANYDVPRLLIAAADPDAIPPTPDVYEDDDSFRRRILLSFEGLSTAGPSGSYIYHALSADADVKDVSATSPAAGEILICVLSRTGDGTASTETLDAVTAALNAEDVRPLCDTVTVQSAEIVNYTIAATIFTFEGPDSAVVVQTAQDAAQAYADEQHRVGRDITLSGVFAALHQAGVQDVELTAPLTNIINDMTKAPYCTAITLTWGGNGD